MTNTKDESGTRFWNESANETDSEIKKEEDGNYENNLENNKSKIEKEVIILNIITSLTILSIFLIMQKNKQEKTVNTLLKIFDIIFLEHWLVYHIKLFWHIIIDVNGKWLYIVRVCFMILLLRKQA